MSGPMAIDKDCGLPQVFFDALQYYAHSGDVACLLAPQRMLLGLHNINGDTALHTAIIAGKTDAALAIARVMIKDDLNIQNSDGQSALHLAVMLGHASVAHALVERGADITARDSRGNTAVHLAANGELARAVLRGAPSEAVRSVLRTFNDNGLNPLHVAAGHGRLDVALELVARHAADVDAQDHATGRTALHHGVRANSRAVCELLLEYEADANAQDHAGNTPLHAAVQYDLFAVTKLLVDFGADCVVSNAYFQSPLDLAMHYGSTEASRAMIAFPSIRIPTKNLELVAQAAFPQMAPAVHATPAPSAAAASPPATAPAPPPTVPRVVHDHAELSRKTEGKSADTAGATESGGMRNSSEGEWQMLDGDELNTEGETEWHVHRNKKLTTGVDKLAKYFNQKRKTKQPDAAPAHSSSALRPAPSAPAHSWPLRSTPSRNAQPTTRSGGSPAALASVGSATATSTSSSSPAPAPSSSSSSAKAEKARLAAQYGTATDVSVAPQPMSAKDEKKMLERKYQPKIELEVAEGARRSTDTSTAAGLTKAAEAAASAAANRIRQPSKFDELSTLD